MRLAFQTSLLLVCVLLLVNCGGGGGPASGCRGQTGTPAPVFEHVYVSNLLERTVAGFSVSATGTLNKIGQASTGGIGSERIVFDPNFNFLYVANKFSSDISIYKVDPSTGALTALAGSPLAVGDPMTDEPIQTIAVHPTGKYLFVANALAGFWAYSVNSTTGALTPVPGTPFLVDAMQPTSIAVHPNGKFLYIAGSSIPSSITTYSIDVSAGTMGKIGSGAAVSDNPVDMTFDEAGKFLFVVNDPAFGDMSAASTTVFAVNADTGELTVAPGSPLRTLTLPRAVAVVGSFLYVLDADARQLGIYNIGTNGSLTQKSVELLSSMTEPSALAVNGKNRSTRYLYMTDAGSESVAGTVAAYRVETSGSLTAIGLPVSTNGTAASMAVATTSTTPTNPCTQ
ncbi:MAG TPA: beta-propeller fold lactonase family protein [Terriglobales bacterium]|nr:beta-propeller fold lactonase family protein [Terriglobales bacterium]